MPDGVRVLEVRWRDAHYALDDEPVGAYVVTTVGWEVRRTRRWLTLACEQTPDGWRGYTRIPCETIEAVRVLGGPPKTVTLGGGAVAVEDEMGGNLKWGLDPVG